MVVDKSIQPLKHGYDLELSGFESPKMGWLNPELHHVGTPAAPCWPDLFSWNSHILPCQVAPQVQEFCCSIALVEISRGFTVDISMVDISMVR